MADVPDQRSCTCMILDLDMPCGDSAEVELVMGCVHEHLAVEDLCARHKHLAHREDLVCSECAPLGVRAVAHVLSADPSAVARLRAALPERTTDG
jgi:hypothetical protein